MNVFSCYKMNFITLTLWSFCKADEDLVFLIVLVPCRRGCRDEYLSKQVGPEKLVCRLPLVGSGMLLLIAVK